MNNLITGALANLPDPTPGAQAFGDFVENNAVDRLLWASSVAVISPLVSIARAASWLGQEPAQVDRAIEAAIANPANIPGLLSGLVYGVLNPGFSMSSLVSALASPFVAAGRVLPSPLGDDLSTGTRGLISQAYNAFAGLVTTVLHAVLPAPIHPMLATASAKATDGAPTAAAPGGSVLDVTTPPSAALPAVTLSVTANTMTATQPGAAAAGAGQTPPPVASRATASTADANAGNAIDHTAAQPPSQQATTRLTTPNATATTPPSGNPATDSQTLSGKTTTGNPADQVAGGPVTVSPTTNTHRPGDRTGTTTGTKAQPGNTGFDGTKPHAAGEAATSKSGPAPTSIAKGNNGSGAGGESGSSNSHASAGAHDAASRPAAMHS